MSRRKQQRVTLFSAPGCAFCRRARDWLRAHGVPFQELDIQRSPKARKQLERLGARAVPVILVGGQRLDGFYPDKLKKLLDRAGPHRHKNP